MRLAWDNDLDDRRHASGISLYSREITAWIYRMFHSSVDFDRCKPVSHVYRHHCLCVWGVGECLYRA